MNARLGNLGSLGAACLAVVAFSGCGGADEVNPPPPDPSAAVAKFCSDLLKDGQPVAVTLRLGPVTLAISTGQCTPVVPEACQAIAPGTVGVVLLDGATVLGHGSLDVSPKEQLVFLATVDETSLPGVKAFELPATTACATFEPTSGATSELATPPEADPPSYFSARWTPAVGKAPLKSWSVIATQ